MNPLFFRPKMEKASFNFSTAAQFLLKNLLFKDRLSSANSTQNRTQEINHSSLGFKVISCI